jgi:hypothetical protein
LQILHDHIDDVGIVWDENLFFYKNTIYIKDEYRKEWLDKVNEARNFFKHADRDLRDGKTTIEFETATTQFHILEAIRCLKLVENDSFDFPFGFQVFLGWYSLKYPKHFKPEGRERFERLNSMNPDNLAEFNALLVLAREHPDLVDSMKKSQARVTSLSIRGYDASLASKSCSAKH